MAKQWTCPHCQHSQVSTESNCENQRFTFRIGMTDIGGTGFEYSATRCLNPVCNKLSFYLGLGKSQRNSFTNEMERNFELWRGSIYPFSTAKPQPDYIPAVVIEDYYEACKIQTLSPKASATLSRRCIQGMIRDFAKIKAPSLYKEIEKLREAIADGSADRSISEESVEALHAVREIGNIGAHMEKDVNHIVEVDEEEAGILIELIEQLFEEWYGEREKRKARLDRVRKVADEKKAVKAQAAT